MKNANILKSVPRYYILLIFFHTATFSCSNSFVFCILTVSIHFLSEFNSHIPILNFLKPTLEWFQLNYCCAFFFYFIHFIIYLFVVILFPLPVYFGLDTSIYFNLISTVNDEVYYFGNLFIVSLSLFSDYFFTV